MIGIPYRDYLDSISDKDSLNYKVFSQNKRFINEVLERKRQEELLKKEIEEEIYRQIEDQIVDVLKKGLGL